MCSRGCTCGCSPDHMRLQPRSHAVAGTLPGAACLESLERAGQSDNFELETHWRMLVLGGGTGAGTLAPPRPTHHPAPRPEHAAHSTSSTWLLYQPTLPAYFAYLLYLLTYSTYLLTPPTYLLQLLNVNTGRLHDDPKAQQLILTNHRAVNDWLI